MHARIASACRLFFSSALIVFLLLNLWSVATPVQAERSNSLSGAGSARPLFAPVPGVTLNVVATTLTGCGGVTGVYPPSIVCVPELVF
jgi:hypothetical protein